MSWIVVPNYEYAETNRAAGTETLQQAYENDTEFKAVVKKTCDLAIQASAKRRNDTNKASIVIHNAPPGIVIFKVTDGDRDWPYHSENLGLSMTNVWDKEGESGERLYPKLDAIYCPTMESLNKVLDETKEVMNRFHSGEKIIERPMQDDFVCVDPVQNPDGSITFVEPNIH